MNVYGSLKIEDMVDIDQELIEITGSVLQQYILEDGLSHEDKNDVRLERLMRTAERYLKRYVDVLNMNSADLNWVSSWQTEQNSVFLDHATAYHRLYQPIGHMASSPYFMSAWSICFVVDSALLEHGIENIDMYKKLTIDEFDEIEYTIRFCENLLQKIHATFFK
jgi:hypothetical protein